MNDPLFISEAVILRMHKDQLERYGGFEGIRDETRFKSALHTPEAGMGETYFHPYPFGMAAAYIFHLAENQPFVDGNKRAALAAGLTFLEAAGITLIDPEGKLYQAMIDMAEHRLNKEGLATLLESLVLK